MIHCINRHFLSFFQSYFEECHIYRGVERIVQITPIALWLVDLHVCALMCTCSLSLYSFSEESQSK